MCHTSGLPDSSRLTRETRALGPDDGNATRTPTAWMISLPLSFQPCTLAAWMILLILVLFQIPFSGWVTSGKRYRVSSA